MSPRFPTGGLIVLATAVFMSVTAEMLPTGLLPQMSADFGVSEASIGLLVTFFALAVVVTSVPLTAVTRRFSRHGLIVAVLVVVAISSILSSLAPTYEFLAVARIVGGTAHGLFWAVVGAYSAHLVAPHQIGRAVAIVTAGGTLAFVFGVPLGTIVGQASNWRVPFAAAGILALGAAVLIFKMLPRVANPVRPGRELGEVRDARGAGGDAGDAARLAGLERPRRKIDASVGAVALLCITTGIIMVGHYSLYTYIAPFLVSQMNIAVDSVGAMLFLFGVAGAVGLALAGFVFNRRASLGLVLSVAVVGLSVFALSLWAANPSVSIVAFVLWGIAFGAVPTLLGARLLHIASARIRDTSSAFYSTSFNIGIALGALLGGTLLSNLGLSSLPFAYLALLAVGGTLLLVAVLRSHLRRRALTPAPAA